jgi:hypothetical protein
VNPFIRRGLLSLAVFSLALLNIPSNSFAVVAIPPAVERLVEFEAFPFCSDVVLDLCLEEFLVDYDSDGSFTEPREDDNIVPKISAFDIASGFPNLVFDIRINEWTQELDPALPVNTPMRLVVNTGDWEPSHVLRSTWKNDSFSMVNRDGDWITSLTFRTNNLSFALDCTPDSCDDPKNRIDFRSYAQGVIWANRVSDPFIALFNGMWVSTNATGWSDPYFNSETLTWTISTAGPALKIDNTPNVANFSAFIPDAAIVGVYGADPASMATQLTATRTDGAISTSQTVVITRVTEPESGIRIDIPAYSFANAAAIPLNSRGLRSVSSDFTAPVLKIKPRYKLLKAPTAFVATKAVKSAKLKSGKVIGALNYQGSCTKGKTVRFVKANTPSILVKKLASGKWSCKIRAVKKLGGTWSVSKSVWVK